MNRATNVDIVADSLKGAIAGAIGVWAMDRVDWFMFRNVDPRARRRTQLARPGGKDPAHVMAGAAAGAAGVELSPPQQNPAGLVVHYSLGILPGALYGALRNRIAGLDAGRGLLFGLGLFAIQDELTNSLARVAAPPHRYPWQAHARGLAAHLVYGLVMDTAFRVLKGPGRSFAAR